MLNLHRAAEILARLAPSVPPDLAGRVDVAFHTHHTTPAPVVPPAGAGLTPEGEDGSPAADSRQQQGSEPQQRRTSPSGLPTVERYQGEPIHPSCRYLFEDRNLAALLTLWTKEAQA